MIWQKTERFRSNAYDVQTTEAWNWTKMKLCPHIAGPFARRQSSRSRQQTMSSTSNQNTAERPLRLVPAPGEQRAGVNVCHSPPLFPGNWQVTDSLAVWQSPPGWQECDAGLCTVVSGKRLRSFQRILPQEDSKKNMPHFLCTVSQRLLTVQRSWCRKKLQLNKNVARYSAMWICGFAYYNIRI